MPRYGRAALAKQKQQRKVYSETGSNANEVTMRHMEEQMVIFKERLEAFALKYKKDVAKDPEFRRDFQRMCARIGVDPLASNKGFWAELLGVGDFYYELGVEATEACLRTRAENGGMIGLGELLVLVNRRRGKVAQSASLDDLERAVEKLKVLGSGVHVRTLGGGRRVVQSVPIELNADQTAVLDLANTIGSSSSSSSGGGGGSSGGSKGGGGARANVTCTQLCDKYGWSHERATRAAEQLVGVGMAWLDTQGTEPSFWFPGLSSSGGAG